ncbi:MAG TPA: HD-GYP domain-containing protein [Dissulfurispiraceae bacterium]|nr:HD-GYP domain-containing protein [Dissulfurispiraceae bacterium]
MNKQGAPVLKNSREIANDLAIIFRISHTYRVDNDAVVRAGDAFIEVIKPVLLQEKTLIIELLGEYFYLNGARVRYSVQHYLNFDFLMNEFRKRGLGSIVFSSDVSCRDLLDFVREFQTCLSSDTPYVDLKGKTDMVATIDIGPLKRAQMDNVLNSRQLLRRNYFTAVSRFKIISGKAKKGEGVEIKKAKLIINSLIDLMLQEEQMMISMTAIKDYDDYTFYHSVNVSILSIALGMKLGLNKKRLSELGIAAFLHDIGKVSVPDEILNKTTPFTDDDWQIIRRHPVEGVKTIMATMKLDHISVRSSIVSYEHHLNIDGSGYPPANGPMKTDFYTNIVTIADRFDAMTASRVYVREPKSPEEALRILSEEAGSHIDPILLKIFIKMVGVYPIGTLVSLDTHELGIVYKGNPEFPYRPVIVLISDGNGRKVESTLVDLAERGLDGNYRRSIKKTLDYNKYKISLSEYLLDAYK